MLFSACSKQSEFEYIDEEVENTDEKPNVIVTDENGNEYSSCRTFGNSIDKRIPFGEQIVVGYLYAREAELTAIRLIMSGRLAGLDGDTIRERLRDSYV